MSNSLDRLRFGVNYVPSKKWWFCWNDFHPQEIAEDLDAISALGADHIRIMLVWPWFQPNPTYVSPAHLDRLETLMELARVRNLDVCVTMLTGWLSGWAFKPSFDSTISSQPGDFYRSGWFRDAVEKYFRACAERLNPFENFLGFDLGNEMNVCWKSASPEEGAAWMDGILSLCDTISPGRLHVNGVDHKPWFHPWVFAAQALARRPSVATIHAWTEFTGALKRGGIRDRVCTHLAPAMAALVRAYAGNPKKPVWLQEFGSARDWAPVEEIPGFLENAVRAAVAGGIERITWWCSHDVQRSYSFGEIEYDLGLIDVENRPKPEGKAFRKMAAEFSGKETPEPPSLVLPPLPELRPGEPEISSEKTWQWLEAVIPQLP